VRDVCQLKTGYESVLIVRALGRDVDYCVDVQLGNTPVNWKQRT